MSNWKLVVGVIAVLTVVGLLPELIIVLGPVVVSTATLAMVYLLARKYGVIGHE